MKSIKLIVSAFVITALSACATLSQNDASFRLVTQYAVLKFIEQTPAAQRAERSQRIVQVASSVRELVTGDTSIELLNLAIRKQLDESTLSPADRLLADALVDVIVTEARSRIGSGTLTPNQLVEVSKILDWVIAAAQVPA